MGTIFTLTGWALAILFAAVTVSAIMRLVRYRGWEVAEAWVSIGFWLCLTLAALTGLGMIRVLTGTVLAVIIALVTGAGIWYAPQRLRLLRMVVVGDPAYLGRELARGAHGPEPRHHEPPAGTGAAPVPAGAGEPRHIPNPATERDIKKQIIALIDPTGDERVGLDELEVEQDGTITFYGPGGRVTVGRWFWRDNNPAVSAVSRLQSRAVPPPAQSVPSVRDDPALGDPPPPAAIAGELASMGVTVPPAWAALAERAATFEPDTDEDLMGHVAEEAAGVLAYADAIRARAENFLHGTGLDPAYVAGHHEFADEFADLAEAVALLDRRFAVIYGQLRDWVDEHPEGMPHRAREFFQGGTTPQSDTGTGEAQAA